MSNQCDISPLKNWDIQKQTISNILNVVSTWNIALLITIYKIFTLLVWFVSLSQVYKLLVLAWKKYEQINLEALLANIKKSES